MPVRTRRPDAAMPEREEPREARARPPSTSSAKLDAKYGEKVLT